MASIERAGVADAGEILTLQRAAYVSEAQLYGDPFIAPLVESLEQLSKVVETAVVLAARDAGRIVGAVRGQVGGPGEHGRTCVVGRLVVAPDRQGQGIGTDLLAAIHDAVLAEYPDVHAFDLFTGHLSDGNLRLYRRQGYRETHRERLQDHMTLVHLRRPAKLPS
ncbi:GCN5 family acetyltransferase [Acrocarpospora phusangensis]|uniref:GCN5 family acetyltransferase n=1 Tax=Acrocarpospora phusangensis TaxID=1070424 RepID=A0A919ULM2_9ACTN|nr:GNAT family N-acetyltransferase [Acrocarpospora phusangensis]GIH26341.1 GCN5 family acetyltransferase [Acrocarpospora phusangensis]